MPSRALDHFQPVLGSLIPCAYYKARDAGPGRILSKATPNGVKPTGQNNAETAEKTNQTIYAGEASAAEAPSSKRNQQTEWGARFAALRDPCGRTSAVLGCPRAAGVSLTPAPCGPGPRTPSAAVPRGPDGRSDAHQDPLGERGQLPAALAPAAALGGGPSALGYRRRLLHPLRAHVHQPRVLEAQSHLPRHARGPAQRSGAGRLASAPAPTPIPSPPPQPPPARASPFGQATCGCSTTASAPPPPPLPT